MISGLLEAETYPVLEKSNGRISLAQAETACLSNALRKKVWQVWTGRCIRALLSTQAFDQPGFATLENERNRVCETDRKSYPTPEQLAEFIK